MTNHTKKAMLKTIQSNIDQHGHHIYVVSGGGPLPRFAYTIGVSQTCSVELILAGAMFYMLEDVTRLINTVAASLKRGADWKGRTIRVDKLGTFSLRKVDPSWTKELMLGALDFFGTRELAALQIVPDQEHWTGDIPDLAQPWSPVAQPVWRWLSEPWAYAVPPESTAVTNLDALRGERITEAARWEEDEWELFAGAGPDIPEDEIRIVPLGTLLAMDETLMPAASLDVGHALYREQDEVEWQPWGEENAG